MIRYKADYRHDYIKYRIRHKVRNDVNPFFYYICIKPFKLIFNLIIKPLFKTQIKEVQINILRYYTFFGLRWLKRNDALEIIRNQTHKNIVLFLLPQNLFMCGGIMSIFSLAKYSREQSADTSTLLITCPGDYTYFKNKEHNKSWKLNQIFTQQTKNYYRIWLKI